MARDAQVNLRVRPSLKAKLEKLAKHDRRTLSAYVERLLEDHRTRASSGEADAQCMTRLILKAVDLGASAVFMVLWTNTFCFYLFKQPSTRSVQSTSDRPRLPSSY
jgi:hypothetical protein